MNAREKQKNNKSFSFQRLFSSSFTSLHFIIFAFHPRCCASRRVFLFCCRCLCHSRKKRREDKTLFFSELLWRPITFMPIRLARENKKTKRFSVDDERLWTLAFYYMIPSFISLCNVGALTTWNFKSLNTCPPKVNSQWHQSIVELRQQWGLRVLIMIN